MKNSLKHATGDNFFPRFLNSFLIVQIQRTKQRFVWLPLPLKLSGNYPLQSPLRALNSSGFQSRYKSFTLLENIKQLLLSPGKYETAQVFNSSYQF